MGLLTLLDRERRPSSAGNDGGAARDGDVGRLRRIRLVPWSGWISLLRVTLPEPAVGSRSWPAWAWTPLMSQASGGAARLQRRQKSIGGQGPFGSGWFDSGFSSWPVAAAVPRTFRAAADIEGVALIVR